MKKGYFYIIFTALVFSTFEIVGKMLSTQINPFQMTFVRFLIGGLILLPFSIIETKRKNIKLGVSDFIFFAVTGLINIVISMSFLQLAIIYTKASIAAVIFSTNSVFTIPFAFFILREKLNLKMLISLFVSILGIVFIFNPLSFAPDLAGILLAIAAAITFSLYSVISKKRINKYGGLVLNCYSFIVGDLILLIGLLVFKLPIYSGISNSNILYILYLGIFVTGIGYITYFAAMKHTSAITASMVFFIKPALAPLLSFIILREKISTNAIIGIILILAGALNVFIGNTKSQKKAIQLTKIDNSGSL